MSGVLIVLLGIMLPFVIMFSGIITMIMSHYNDTVKGMIIGIIMAAGGGFWFVFFSVHELMMYAPYFTNDISVF